MSRDHSPINKANRVQEDRGLKYLRNWDPFLCCGTMPACSAPNKRGRGAPSYIVICLLTARSDDNKFHRQIPSHQEKPWSGDSQPVGRFLSYMPSGRRQFVPAAVGYASTLLLDWPCRLLNRVGEQAVSIAAPDPISARYYSGLEPG